MAIPKPSAVQEQASPRPAFLGKFRDGNWTTFTYYLVLLLLAYIVLVPMVTLLYSSVGSGPGLLPFERWMFTFENYVQVLTDPVTYRIVGNTVWFTLGSITVCMSLAILLAWILERTNFPMRTFTIVLLMAPMAIPNMIYAIAWTQLMDPTIGLINLVLQNLFGFEKGPFNVYTLAGMAFVQGLHMVPTAYLMIAATFATLDPTLEEQSAICGKSTFTTTRRITLPILRPALLACIIYFMVVSVETFEIPGTLGFTAKAPVLATQIYFATHPIAGQLPNYGLVSVLGVILLIFAFILITIYQRLTRNSERFATVTGKGYRPRKVDLGRYKPLVVAFVWLFAFVSVFLPFLILIWTSLHPFYVPPSWETLKTSTFAAYKNVFSDPAMGGIIWNTVILTLVSGVITVALGLLVGWVVIRGPYTPGQRRRVDILSFMPQAIPATVIGLSLMFFYIRMPFALYGTLFVLIVGVVTKYIAFASRSFISAQIQISKELEEASVIAGANWPRTMRRVLLPLMTPVLLNCFLWVAVHAMRELAVVIMLYSPKSLVLSTRIWHYWESGWTANASVLGVFLIVMLTLIYFGGQVIVNRLAKLREVR